eukprot:464203-Prorocentrum_minimum.AAC.1
MPIEWFTCSTIRSSNSSRRGSCRYVGGRSRASQGTVTGQSAQSQNSCVQQLLRLRVLVRSVAAIHSHSHSHRHSHLLRPVLPLVVGTTGATWLPMPPF